MNKAEEFLELQKLVKQAREQASRAEGGLAEIMKRIEDEFGCDSLKAAKTKIKKLQQEKAEAEEKFEAGKRDFEKHWSNDIQG